MTKSDVERMIRRRYRISQRAVKAESAFSDRPNGSVISFHEGAMSVCLCLLSDLRQKRLPAASKEGA